MAITIHEHKITIASESVTLEINKDRLESIEINGLNWLVEPTFLLTFLFAGEKEAHFEASSCSIVQLGEHAVDLIYDGMLGHVNVRIEVYGEDIWLTPCAITTRAGFKALRLNLGIIDANRDLIIPTYQGVRIDKDCPYLRKERLAWPYVWEAAILFIENQAGECFYAWTEDPEDRYKALNINRDSNGMQIGLETENNGPFHDKKEVGGHTWRLAASLQGWNAAAERYADWLEATWKLKEIRSQRAAWHDEIRFAVSWCPADPHVLDAIAQYIAPKHVLIHFPGWRLDPYDRNYPNYVLDPNIRPFLDKARGMGFHVMLHFNIISVSTNHALFRLFSEYQYRDVETAALMAWYGGLNNGNFASCPQNPLLERYAETDVLLSYTHMGLTRWRNEITKQVLTVLNLEQSDCVFLDQTNGLPNINNAVVEGRTCIDGVQMIMGDLTRMKPGLIIGGEGLNEVSMRYQAFTQLHLFQSHRVSIEGLEQYSYRVCDLLYRGHTKFIAYCNNDGHDEAAELRIRVHEKLGGMPSMTLNDRTIDDLLKPNQAVRDLFDRANGLRN